MRIHMPTSLVTERKNAKRVTTLTSGGRRSSNTTPQAFHSRVGMRMCHARRATPQSERWTGATCCSINPRPGIVTLVMEQAFQKRSLLPQEYKMKKCSCRRCITTAFCNGLKNNVCCIVSSIGNQANYRFPSASNRHHCWIIAVAFLTTRPDSARRGTSRPSRRSQLSAYWPRTHNSR